VVLARSLNPIPSRTRPLNSSAPMVLWLKPWESRSLPGLPRTKIPLQRFHDQTKRRFPSGRRRFAVGASFEARGAVGSCDKRRPCPREMRGTWRALRHDHRSSEPIAQIFENIFNIRGDLDEGRVKRHWPLKLLPRHQLFGFGRPRFAVPRTGPLSFGHDLPTASPGSETIHFQSRTQVRLEFETPQPRRLRCVSSFVPSPSRRALPASPP
jgi:hypothetical protein